MDVQTDKLRKFIKEYFSPDELNTLLLDYFRPVYDDLTNGMTKSQQILLLIEFCHNQNKFEQLLAAIKREKQFFQPENYAQLQNPAVFIPQLPATINRNPHQIFISYANQDSEIAQRLASDLKANNWKTWIASESIRPGEKWNDAINRGLFECGKFLLLLTPHALASTYVRDETNAVIHYKSRGEKIDILPIQIKSISEIELPWNWLTYQRLPFPNDYEAGFETLLDLLAGKKRSFGKKEILSSQLQQENEGDFSELKSLSVDIYQANDPAPPVKIHKEDSQLKKEQSNIAESENKVFEFNTLSENSRPNIIEENKARKKSSSNNLMDSEMSSLVILENQRPANLRRIEPLKNSELRSMVFPSPRFRSMLMLGGVIFLVFSILLSGSGEMIGNFLFWMLTMPGLVIGSYVQSRLKSNLNKYSKMRTLRNVTGAQVARQMLDAQGLYNVEIKETQGFLSNYYDSRNKILRLSQPVYRTPSIAAAGLAAHEIGHALQDSVGYSPLQIRNVLVPAIYLCNFLSPWLLISSALLNITGIAWGGVIAFAVAFGFSLIILPVEFDASNRAKQLLERGVLVGDELKNANKVLDVAIWI